MNQITLIIIVIYALLIGYVIYRSVKWYKHDIWIDGFTSEQNKNPYRLGDIVRHLAKPDGHEGTIGYEYCQLTDAKNDYLVLNHICTKRRHTVRNLPKDNELIIHVRLGDVIEKSMYTVDQHLNMERISKNKLISPNRIYIRGRDYFENYVIDSIKNKHIDTVIFVGGDHFNLDSLEKTKEYLNKVSDIFKNKGYRTVIRFNENTADDDFVYLSNAKHFVPTGGGYSLLVTEMVKLYGNNVYGIVDDPEKHKI